MSLFSKHYINAVFDQKQLQSGYYYWYLFMREVPKYGPKHKLWKDFGDVSVPFDEWFSDDRVDKLFNDGYWQGVKQIKSVGEFKRAAAEDYLVISLNLSIPRSQLIQLIRLELANVDCEQNLPASQGRREHDIERGKAKYTFWQRVDTTSLKATYDCWIYFKENPHATLYDIGKALNLIPPSQKITADIRKQKAVVSQRKSVVNSNISRNLRRARKLIENVGIGIFPCFD